MIDFFAVDNKRENTSDFDEEDDYFDSSVSFKSDEVDDMSEEQSEKKAENWVQRPPRAIALYPFQSENSETLEMTEGEEFFILEDDKIMSKDSSMMLVDPRTLLRNGDSSDENELNILICKPRNEITFASLRRI